MRFVIYAIRHTASGNAYFGSSRNEPHRRAIHKSTLRKRKHHSAPLQSAWDTYGELAFCFEIIETLETEREMLARERFWLRQPAAVFNVKKYGMRVNHTPEHRAAIAQANQKRWADPDYKAQVSTAISKAKTGKKIGPHSPERYEKIASANKRRGLDQIGKPLNAATKAKMSATRRGMKRSPETKAKIAAKLIGNTNRKKSC